MVDRRARLVRVREDALAPAQVQPRHREVRPAAERAEAVNLIRAQIDRQNLAFEIQQVCAVVPLTPDEEERFSALREIRERYARTPIAADLRELVEAATAERAAAYQSLVGRLACTHCAARGICPAAHARRMN